jgi:membrane-bound ClpP family serine protease
MPLPRALCPFAVAVACVFGPAAAALAQDATGDAAFVTVQNPITSDAFKRIQNQISQRLNAPDGQRRLSAVVFDFNPDGKPAFTPDFGPCFDLAEYIGSLKGQVNTIAFVNGPVTGHTVLPVLACKERVMRDKATTSGQPPGVIGPIVTQGVPPLTGARVTAYREKTPPDLWPLVQKMFDQNVRLVRGRAREGADRTVYADARDKQPAELPAGAAPVQGVQEGQYAGYDAPLARNVGLSQGRADSRSEVAEVYALPPSSVRDDPLRGQTPEAFQWTLSGDIDGAKREQVNRIIRDVRKKKGNVLFLVLKDAGGIDLDAARGLADDLVKAQTGDDAVQVIAFVPEAAPDAAAVVALGCSEIVMGRTKGDNGEFKEAEFGNFDRYLKSAQFGAIDAQRKSLRELAEQQGYAGVLIDGMLDKKVEIVRAAARDNPRKTKLMTRAEFDADQKAGAEQKPPQVPWADVPKTVKPKDMPFHPKASEAAELGLARSVVPSTSLADVLQIYGVREAKSPEAGWVDKLADFLRIPAVTIILVMLGFIGLILELKVPGLTVPGIVAALCFILVFWSQSRFSGEMFVLALLLFLLGLFLLGLEIFVLPGFGVCGICGILFMLTGLGVVTLEKMPSNTGEWAGFGVRVSYYLFALMGAVVMAFLIARFLPQVPGANRLLLSPPSDGPAAADPVLPGALEALELLGAIGTTTTALRPAGVVRFGDKFVDVVSDGGFIPTGSRVQVIAVEGTRIVVKEV